MFKLQKKDNYFLVSLEFNNKTYYNELSVLDGFSKEHLDEAHDQLISITSKINKIENIKLEEPLFAQANLEESIFPSVLFCLEGLFLQTLPPLYRGEYRVNTLITDFEKDFQTAQTVKIKINKECSSEKVQNLLTNHPEIKKIRLDANQSSPNLSGYNFTELEYFEEPYLEYMLYKNETRPIAIDENIKSFINDPMPPKCIKALIYKPKVRLGISGMIKTIKKYPGLRHVLSHSYEQQEGAYVLKLLPLYIKELNNECHGLDFSYLGSDASAPSGIEV